MNTAGIQVPLPWVVKSSKTVERDSQDVYPMKSQPRGPCLIINNTKFDHLESRKGSELDNVRLEYVFTELGFSVTIKRNLTTQSMRQALRTLAEDDKTNMKCDVLAVVVLSHGNQGFICGTEYDPKDRRKNNLTHKDLVEPFNNKNCPKLRHKPKLFFIQACQGERLSVGLEDLSIGGNLPVRPYRLVPETSDMLLAFASQEEYTATRSESLGSIFITHLTFVLAEHAHEKNLLDMLTIVERKVRDTWAVHTSTVSKNPISTDLCLSTSVKLLGWARKLYFDPVSEEMLLSNSPQKLHILKSETPCLWVIGGLKDPEVLDCDGREWMIKYNTGLEICHGPVPNSPGPLYVHYNDEIYTWEKDKRAFTKSVSKTLLDKAAFAYHDGEIYVMGGEIYYGQSTTFCSALDANTCTWKNLHQILHLSKPTSGKTAVVLQGKIYITPGGRDEVLGVLDILDPRQKTVTTAGAQMIVPRRGHAIAACRSYVWVFGGHNGTRCLTDVERYCPDKDRWENMKPMPTARCNLSVSFFGRKFYAIGGETGDGILDTVEVYDPEKDVWVTGPPLANARTGHGSIVF